ncbi:MAG: sigma-70 family RNA polymerase sigma factor [Myxococcales bacterium]|nr:sigma-70 family RNA polymerase sigma factor [Myxococcales bacterium]
MAGGSSRSARDRVAAKGAGAAEQAEDAPSDSELVRKAREGSREAFEVLVRRFSERAYRVAFRILRDADQSEDVLQDAFIKAYRGIRKFEQRSAFYTWLYRIVVNLALDRRRRERPGTRVEWDDGVAHEIEPRAVVGQPPDPDATARRAQVRRILSEGIQQLPDGQREVLLLREVEGLSYEEIAKAMEISKGTVMSRLHYARRKLTSFLRERGVSPEDAA